MKHPRGDDDASIWLCRDPAAFASLGHQIVAQTDDYHIWAECDFTPGINASRGRILCASFRYGSFFVVVHSRNTVSSLLESSEDLAFQCIAV